MADKPARLTAEDLMFAAAVKRRREGDGITQRKLAERVGVSERTIYLIEAGQRGVTRGEAVALARAFGVAVEEMTDAVSPAAIRVSWKTGEVARRLEESIYEALAEAEAQATALLEDLRVSVREIDELPRVDEQTERFYAMTVEDATYMLERLPAFKEATWSGVQAFMANVETGSRASGAVALGEALKRAERLLSNQPFGSPGSV